MTNSLFMAIFQVTLLYQPDELYLPADLNEHVEASLVSLKYDLFKTIFWGRLLYQLGEHCLPGDLDNECAK